MTIAEWLKVAKKQLNSKDISTYILDSEILLSYVIKKNRTFLHSHDNNLLSLRERIVANRLLKKRSKNIPVAHLVGEKEFYGRSFVVNKKVLIPKPESEAIIDFLKKIAGQKPLSVIDVGTGSGCLGITAKLEIPNLNITLSDIDKNALKIAKLNSKLLNCTVNFVRSDLLEKTDANFDIIIANLPYVSKSWSVSKETNFEPKKALYSTHGGIFLIKKLIKSSHSKNLILESDPRQQTEILDFAKKYNYTLVEKTDYVMHLESY